MTITVVVGDDKKRELNVEGVPEVIGKDPECLKTLTEQMRRAYVVGRGHGLLEGLTSQSEKTIELI